MSSVSHRSEILPSYEEATHNCPPAYTSAWPTLSQTNLAIPAQAHLTASDRFVTGGQMEAGQMPRRAPMEQMQLSAPAVRYDQPRGESDGMVRCMLGCCGISPVKVAMSSCFVLGIILLVVGHRNDSEPVRALGAGVFTLSILAPIAWHKVRN